MLMVLLLKPVVVVVVRLKIVVQLTMQSLKNCNDDKINDDDNDKDDMMW